MIKYINLTCDNLDAETIDRAYSGLLNSKSSFGIMKVNYQNYIITKEKSFFKIDNLEEFINDANNDIYFKTNIGNNKEYLEDDLKLYFKYLNKYKNQMMMKYNDKYIFGSIAVKTINNNIITTIRGKENFDEFTIINSVDFNNYIVNVSDKKATLNAPLLYYLFNKDNVKAIVHINHKFDDSLPFLPYAFPGTLKDSIRDINESFNIDYHGVFMLFDNNETMIRGDYNE